MSRRHDPFHQAPPESGVVSVLRWMYRTRRPMAPVYAGGAVWLLGVLSWHYRDPYWTGGVAGMVVLAGGATVLGLRSLGAADRAFYGSLLLCSATWTVVAAIVEPWHRWMVYVLGALTLVHAVAWWTNQRLDRRIRVERMIESWPDVADAVGLRGARMARGGFVATRTGWEATVTGVEGREVVSRTGKIEAELGLRRGRLRVLLTDRANKVKLVYSERDAHPGGTKLRQPVLRSIADEFAIGVRPDGTPMMLRLYDRKVGGRHGLIAGMTGSGKSNLLHLIISYVMAAPDAVAWIIDLKGGGQEHASWTRSTDWLAVSQNDAVGMVDSLNRIINVRGKISRKVWGKNIWQPSAEHPVIVVFIDEAAELTGDMSLMTALNKLKSIARTARTLGIVLVFATQYPTNEAIGSSQIKAQMWWKWCGRLNRRGQAQHVLSSYDDGIDVSALPSEQPGSAYIEIGEHEPARHRTHEIEDDAIDQHARRLGPQQPVLDSGTVRAAGDEYANRDRDPLGELDEDERAEWFTATPTGDGDDPGDDEDGGDVTVPDRGYWKTLVLPRDGEDADGEATVMIEGRPASGRDDFNPDEVFTEEFPPIPNVPLRDLVAAAPTAPATLTEVPKPRTPAEAMAAFMEALRNAAPTESSDGGISPKELCEATGWSRGHVHRRLEEGIQDGTVRRIGNGTKGRYILGAAAQASAGAPRSGA